MRFRDSTARLKFNEIWNDTICPLSKEVMNNKNVLLGTILVVGAIGQFHKASENFLNHIKQHFEDAGYTDKANTKRYLESVHKAIINEYGAFERRFPQCKSLIEDFKVILDCIIDKGPFLCMDDEPQSPCL